MAGKFINELSSNSPAPEDLVVFFDKSKAVTVQAPLSDVVGAGLNLSAATKGQTAVVDTKVDPISLETIPFLKWEKAGIDFGSTTTKPSAGTDEIITHDPVTGTNGKTTLAELIKSVLPPVTGADAGKQLTVDINGVAGWTADSSDLPVFSPADAKKQLTVNDAGDAVIWKADASELPAFTAADKGKQLTVQADGKVAWSSDSSELPAITLGSQILATKADKSGVEWAPIEKELPDFTLKPAGSRLATNSTRTGVEWVNPPAELPAALGTAGQILLVNSTATNPVWQYGLQMPSAAPGTSLTIRAASANALGKGGDLVLQAGSQNASGGDGVVSVRQPTGGSGTAEVFSIKNASGASIFSQFGTGDMTIGNGALYQNNGINLYHSTYPGISFSNSSTTASKSCLINVEGAAKIFSISTRNNAGYAVSIGTKPDTNGQLAVHATGVNIANAAAFNGNGGSALFIESFSTSKNAVVVDGLPGQTADLLLFRKQNTITAGDVTNLCSVSKEGAFKPAAMADSAAPNNSMYFSTTANKLVYKDASGLVNNLY